MEWTVAGTVELLYSTVTSHRHKPYPFVFGQGMGLSLLYCTVLGAATDREIRINLNLSSPRTGALALC